jgi:hypothetical protein
MLKVYHSPAAFCTELNRRPVCPEITSRKRAALLAEIAARNPDALTARSWTERAGKAAYWNRYAIPEFFQTALCSHPSLIRKSLSTED